VAGRYIEHDGHLASLACLNYSDVYPQYKTVALHKAWGAKMRAHIGEVKRPDPADKDADRRLKIAYLSPDLQRHPCAYFIEPFLRNHDRAVVHVTVYQCNPGGDDYTEMLKGLADEWVYAAVMPEAMIAEHIRKSEIDIAVDLAGQMVMRPASKHPSQVLAHYPAPVQVTWIGYPNTTAVDCIHYRLVDSITDPPDTQQWHCEELWRLPDCFLCFAPPQVLPPITTKHKTLLSPPTCSYPPQHRGHTNIRGEIDV